MSRRSSHSGGQKCPAGKIFRRAYTRHRGKSRISVAGNCITATSQSRQKRSVQDRKYLAERAKIQKEARKKFSKKASQKCPPGKVLREGFYRKSTHRRAYSRQSGARIEGSDVAGAWVPPTCVPSINRQKKKRLFVLERNVLAKYGYHNVHTLTARQRHDALDKALRAGIEPLPLLRRVNALYVLNKNKDPELAEKFHEDVDYIRHTKGYQSRPTAKSASSKSTKSKRSKKSKSRK